MNLVEALLDRTAQAQVTERGTILGWLAAAWGLVGVSALLLRALSRLTPVAIEGLGSPSLGPWHWVAAAVWLVAMAYFEGYKGFQRGFAPRVVVRALHLVRHPQPLHVLLAPLFCMGLIHARKRRLITSWIVVAGVVTLVFAVGLLAQPWRGLVDAGVVVGLAWGLAAIVGYAVRALTGRPPQMSADLPAKN